jgi:hypothetical protein
MGGGNVILEESFFNPAQCLIIKKPALPQARDVSNPGLRQGRHDMIVVHRGITSYLKKSLLICCKWGILERET